MSNNNRQSPEECKADTETQSESADGHPKSVARRNTGVRTMVIKIAEAAGAVGLFGAGVLIFKSHPAFAFSCLFLALTAFMVAVYLTRWPTLKKCAKWKRTRTDRIFVAIEAAILMGCVSLTWLTWTEPEKLLRGLLVPAYEPSPASVCGNLPDSAFALYYGDSVAWTDRPEKTVNAIRFAGETVLAFERTSSGGILVNAIIRDENGIEVATIKRNVFRAAYGSKYDATSQDAHSILVLDKADRVILYVRYLNPQAVKVTGVFRELNRVPVTIGDNGAEQGSSVYSRTCFQFMPTTAAGMEFE